MWQGISRASVTNPTCEVTQVSDSTWTYSSWWVSLRYSSSQHPSSLKALMPLFSTLYPCHYELTGFLVMLPEEMTSLGQGHTSSQDQYPHPSSHTAFSNLLHRDNRLVTPAVTSMTHISLLPVFYSWFKCLCKLQKITSNHSFIFYKELYRTVKE